MAGLEPIRFEKNWFKNSKTAEANWDEIADKTASYALRTNNNLKQIGLDKSAQGSWEEQGLKPHKGEPLFPRI